MQSANAALEREIEADARKGVGFPSSHDLLMPILNRHFIFKCGSSSTKMKRGSLDANCSLPRNVFLGAVDVAK